MKKLTVKEIMNMEDKELEKIITQEQFEKMKKLNIKYVWQLLELLQESAKLSGQKEDEEHISIDDYLEYLENMKN